MDINVDIDWGWTILGYYLKVKPRSFQGHPKVKSHAYLNNLSLFVLFVAFY